MHDHHHHAPDEGGGHDGPASVGHNHPEATHLRSHLHGGDARRDELQALAASFVEGFRNASDKASYLRLAGIPLSRPGADGRDMHLVDAAISETWQIGTASPGFGTRELVYMAYPGEMITGRETMTFVYVSLTGRADVDLLELLAERRSTPEG